MIAEAIIPGLFIRKFTGVTIFTWIMRERAHLNTPSAESLR